MKNTIARAALITLALTGAKIPDAMASWPAGVWHAEVAMSVAKTSRFGDQLAERLRRGQSSPTAYPT